MSRCVISQIFCALFLKAQKCLLVLKIRHGTSARRSIGFGSQLVLCTNVFTFDALGCQFHESLDLLLGGVAKFAFFKGRHKGAVALDDGPNILQQFGLEFCHVMVVLETGIGHFTPAAQAAVVLDQLCVNDIWIILELGQDGLGRRRCLAIKVVHWKRQPLIRRRDLHTFNQRF